MGSPLAPILANLFLRFYEETWLNNLNKADILLYVDDTFCVYKNVFLSSFKLYCNGMPETNHFSFALLCGARKTETVVRNRLRSSLFRFLLAGESESQGEVARTHGARA